MATPTAIAAYLALFATVAAVFLFANLVIGRLTRPKLPSEEKLEVYECGEPVIGSSFVQFDLRFYVIALLFIIFDVEIAFFFPWATVFGKSVELTSPNMAIVATEADGTEYLTGAAVNRLQELGISNPKLPAGEAGVGEGELLQQTAKKIALTSFADIGVFFAVLLVGFAYVWKRGDLDWVRTVASQKGEVVTRAPPQGTDVLPKNSGSVLSA